MRKAVKQPNEEALDPALRRIQRDRRAGELDSAMASGSDEGEISATERFEGEMSRKEALEVLAPDPKSASRRPRSTRRPQTVGERPRRAGG
jgi:hypothetical protein